MATASPLALSADADVQKIADSFADSIFLCIFLSQLIAVLSSISILVEQSAEEKMWPRRIHLDKRQKIDKNPSSQQRILQAPPRKKSKISHSAR